MEDKAAQSRGDLARERTSLAIRRTVLATDRSLQATLRTSVAMIGFGFTIFKFLQETGAEFGIRDRGPVEIGLFLCGLGTVVMIVEMVTYWKTLKAYGGLYKVPEISPWRLPLFSAAGIAGLGVWLFALIALRGFAG